MLRLTRLVVNLARACFSTLQKLGQQFDASSGALVISDERLMPSQRDDILHRAAFYAPSLASTVQFRTTCSVSDVISTRPILLHRQKLGIYGWLKRIRENCYDINAQVNPSAGWEWCRLSFAMTGKRARSDARKRFICYLADLRRSNFQRCYIFGTGPSLERAMSMDWSDGYRIVCNTIVRDEQLWNHINPHFMVAADAIYHFGFTPFARQFRADLRARLTQTNTCFVYPEAFHGIVMAEFAAFSERLIPIPQGLRDGIHQSLEEKFDLPNLGNVLNLVLLPLACTLSRNVFLWGFDGRAPGDKLFWSNSTKHSYPELMPTLIDAHPAFFEHYVPKADPNRYVKSVHGEELDEALAKAESAGWRFVMMHKTWTVTLQKRFLAKRENGRELC